MRTFTFKGLFLTAVFMLLGCLSIQAADDDLITRQITIKLDKAGTLPDKIGSSKKNLITKLKIVGEVNGTDWCFIREMAGSGYDGKSTEGKLSVLDLSEAKIVEGGYYYNKYYYYENDVYYYKNCYTSNDVIGKCAFKGCSGLTSLTLSDGITEIGWGAFEGCSGLKEVRFCINDNLDTYLTKGHPYIGVGCGIKYYINNKEITSIEIPSNVTTLGKCVFQGCSGLTSLTLPAGITEIGDEAFEYCSGLTSLTLPAGITEIGSSAFEYCSGLTSLTLPAGITEISSYAFSSCSGLTSLTLPAGITSISDGTFRDCSGLTSIYVYEEKVPIIGSNVFKGCDAKKCTVYVPMGTYNDYRLSEFGDYFENIVEFDVTGIDKTTTSTDIEEVARYSVNGQRLSAPTKGLNIVKYSNGSVKKVAVR